MVLPAATTVESALRLKSAFSSLARTIHGCSIHTWLFYWPCTRREGASRFSQRADRLHTCSHRCTTRRLLYTHGTGMGVGRLGLPPGRVGRLQGVPGRWSASFLARFSGARGGASCACDLGAAQPRYSHVAKVTGPKMRSERAASRTQEVSRSYASAPGVRWEGPGAGRRPQ